MAVDILWTVLTILALGSLLPTAASLVQGLRLRGNVRRAMRLAFGAYLPRAAVILPVRGLDAGFDENVRAILSQAHPRFRVLVVVDDASDPGAMRIPELAQAFPQTSVSVILSDPTAVPGKVNALRSALSHLSAADEVIVFADSDIRPARDWLRQLVQPLADSTVGVATGFRWYVPPEPTFWSLVRTEWNAVSANVLFDPPRAFAWGGSCAIRRETLTNLALPERWRGVLSDDLVLTRCIHEAGLRIAYVPAALVPTFEGASRSACLEWCLRQMTMATLYFPIVRRYAAMAFALLDGSLLLGIASLLLLFGLGPSYLIPASLFLLPLPATVAKSFLRRRAFFSASPTLASAWDVSRWRTALAALAVPWVMAYGLVRTRHPKVLQWRGRTYDVADPSRIRILDRT